MKDHFDRWLSRHPRNQYRRTGREVSGIGHTIFKTYWFKWPDADTFKERLIELLACYPDGLIANEDEESCDTVWEAVTGVIREQKALSERMIPLSVKATFDTARQQRMALPGYSESDSWRWGRVDGYACFVNNFAVDGVPNRVTEWSRDRLRQGHHYEAHVDSMTALRVDVIARIAKTVNPVLESAITALIAPASAVIQELHHTMNRARKTLKTRQTQRFLPRSTHGLLSYRLSLTTWLGFLLLSWLGASVILEDGARGLGSGNSATLPNG